MRRLAMLAIVGSVLLVAFAGVAWAANFTCTGGPCVGTEENDLISGSQVRDEIQALGGLDVVSARGGDDQVDGGRNRDDIFGGQGGDVLFGGGGPDDIDGGPVTPGQHFFSFECGISDTEAGIDISIHGNQYLVGNDGNDDLDGGIDNDLMFGDFGKNDLSGNGGDDCLGLNGVENERASGGDGDDVITAFDLTVDDVFCGAGHDTVRADPDDRVAANCEDVIRKPSLQATGATPVVEVTTTTPEGTITTAP